LSKYRTNTDAHRQNLVIPNEDQLLKNDHANDEVKISLIIWLI